MCCKLFCPALCVLILGLLRMEFEVTPADIEWGYPMDDYYVTETSIRSSNWIGIPFYISSR